ncbi:hypothetical protein Mcup_1121 [Metallosphaera cuprina Ar-4]|uniref:Uncharacterized protein n=1 Tax=Metallosphaera cuprina (strain Ar-4) TaxID=1006006 RepID=F4G328_METCR|nr:hypothetical protein Mcup_1121 [Metallosphaera cuprina Ar-4]
MELKVFFDIWLIFSLIKCRILHGVERLTTVPVSLLVKST